jgi:6-phosphofructokinase
VDAFVGAVDDAYRRYGYAVAVIAETLRDEQGRPLGLPNAIQQQDAFGHPTLSGAAHALTHIVGATLRVKARFDKPGTIQRMCMALASSVDLDEAFAAGQRAVQLALEGKSGCMVGFQRVSSEPYLLEMVPVDLQEVANHFRPLPPEFLGGDPFSISSEYRTYLRPLIDPPLLTYARLV